MNVTDLDGNVSSWKLTGYTTGIQNRTTRSKYHMTARQLLQDTYPTFKILEEVTIQIRRGTSLYLDFYIPLLKKCIEVHGEQHYQFIPFFHSDKMGFLKQLGRDRDKEEWCDINDVEITVLKYDETEKWPEQL